MKNEEKNIETMLGGAREVIASCLRRTSLGCMFHELTGLVGSGKMLRVRIIYRVGVAAGMPMEALNKAAAAVELLHAASLLHDDVIDGAFLRRGIPAFWVAKGTAGAVLLGDLLVGQAFKLSKGLQSGRFVNAMADLANEMCEAETEQELLLKGKAPDWPTCVSIARRKTGSLFALAGYAAGGDDVELCDVLMNAGYAAGTAYQLGDDIFDAYGDEKVAGKTLGNDAASGKVTAASACLESGVNPRLFIAELLTDSEKMLVSQPAVADAWRDYLKKDLLPVLDSFLAPFQARTA